MPFTFKLSQRLARMRCALLISSTAVAAACEKPVAGPVGSGPQVAQVVVSPDIVTLLPSQTEQFIAFGRTAAGDSVSVVATWSASAGSISPSGLYAAAAAAGAATITATSEGKSGTATVTVSAVPVATVTVSPATPSVTVGQTAQLTATPKDANGSVLVGRVVTWASGNAAVATVSSSGLVTGVTAGSDTITATSEGKSGTAAITVTAPSVTVPGTVSDLAVIGATDSSATLAFTEVTDGTGQPASYDIRYVPGTSLSWGASVPSVSRGTCATPVVGTAVGAKRTCAVLGLAAATTYTFELVAYRGTLTVNAVFGALSNASTGTTGASTAPIASVSVTPASATVTVGNVQQVTATLKDASGNVLLGRAVAWTSDNAGVATVNGTGLVTGVAPGSATITATSEGKSGTAAITVTAGAGGGTVLVQESFADAGFATRGWYDNPAMAITTAEHSPGSTSALEIHFTPGAMGPTWGGAARHAFAPTPTLYISYWVKYGATWVGSGTLNHPHEFYVLSDLDGQYASLANDWLTTYIETNFVNGAGTPRVSLQDNRAINTSYGPVPVNLIGLTENRSVSGCNGVVETNLVSECYGGSYNDKQLNRGGTVTFQVLPGAGYKGDWNHVEVYFQINSIVNGVGIPDGIVQYWFNGTLVIDRHDILFRAGARTIFNFAQFVIAPYIGGTGSPVDQTMWVDNLTVATGRP